MGKIERDAAPSAIEELLVYARKQKPLTIYGGPLQVACYVVGSHVIYVSIDDGYDEESGKRDHGPPEIEVFVLDTADIAEQLLDAHNPE